MAGGKRRDEFHIKDIRKVTQQDLALLLGVTTRTIRDWKGCPRNKDKSYPLPEVIRWWGTDHMREMDLRALDDVDTRMLDAGADIESDPELRELLRDPSMATKYWQSQRHRQAYLKEAGELLRRENVRDMLALVASRYRQAGVELSKRHGNEAAEVINRALDDADRQIRKVLTDKKGSTHDEGDADTGDE